MTNADRMNNFDDFVSCSASSHLESDSAASTVVKYLLMKSGL